MSYTLVNLSLVLYSNKLDLVYISHKLMEYLHCYSFETFAGGRSRNIKKKQTEMKKFCLSRRRNMQMTIYPWGEMFSVLSALSRIVPSKLLKKVNVTNPARTWDILN